MPDALLFARMFLKYPAMLGSIWPSSDYLCKRLMLQIDWRKVDTVVEYGPGVGTITRHLLRNLHPRGTLVAIEKNPELVAALSRKLAANDRRLKLVEGSAADVRTMLDQLGLAAADCIVSGIPFSLIPENEVRSIMDGTRESLGPGGRLLIYQFTGAIEPVLREHFQDVRSEYELRNFLPARTYLATNV
jgi:phospholipid N-methyltransferase